MLAEPKAVLWDFDGTLVDTEPIWDETQDGMLAERGLEFTAEHRALMRGSSSMVTAEIMAELYADGTTAQEVFDDVHARMVARLTADLPWMPVQVQQGEQADAGEQGAVESEQHPGQQR